MDYTDYIRDLFVKEDKILASISPKLSDLGLPLISVPPEVGHLLTLLVKMTGAKSILEIGTLAGYSTICLARGLPEYGHCTTIELKEEHAKIATEHFRLAGINDQVRVLIGNASEQLTHLQQKNAKFDFFFLDADKVSYPYYLEQVIGLAHPEAVILLDNLLLGGRVLDSSDQNPAPTAVRQVTKMLANDPRIESIILPIGDGLGVARVR